LFPELLVQNKFKAYTIRCCRATNGITKFCGPTYQLQSWC